MSIEKPTIQELRSQWEALASNPQEAFMMLPKEALIASVRDLAKDLLEITDKYKETNNGY